MGVDKGTEDGAAGRRSLPSVAIEQPIAASAGRPAPALDARSGGEHQTATVTGDPRLDRSDIPALIIDDHHRIRAANRRCAELFAGDRLLGRHCYEVFHRQQAACDGKAWRCPLRYYRETGEPCRVVHVHHNRQGREHHEISIVPTGAGLDTVLELRPVVIPVPGPCPCRLVGRSPAFNRMLELLLRAAPQQVPVLVLGEPGTCRETMARALHRLGGKTDEAFVTVPCRGLRGQRFANELACLSARGAKAAREGRGGTLYLDDVGELGAGEQGELLRLLKVAGRRRAVNRTEAPRPRLVFAARPDLSAKVARGEFLDDLYYRVSIFPIPLPPLRERREDLPLLAECLLGEIGGDPPLEIAPQTLRVLDRYSFPGNLRELRSILEHASLVATGRQVLPAHLSHECRSDAP